MTSKKDVSVTHSNYDVIFKYLTEMFEDKALTFYGLETPPIVRAEKTDLPNIRVDERLMDFVFLLADGSYLHLEDVLFRTDGKLLDLVELGVSEAFPQLFQEMPPALLIVRELMSDLTVPGHNERLVSGQSLQEPERVLFEGNIEQQFNIVEQDYVATKGIHDLRQQAGKLQRPQNLFTSDGVESPSEAPIFSFS